MYINIYIYIDKIGNTYLEKIYNKCHLHLFIIVIIVIEKKNENERNEKKNAFRAILMVSSSVKLHQQDWFYD